MKLRHLNSSQHKKKLLLKTTKKGQLECLTCSKVFNSLNQKKYHLKSDAHHNLMKKQQAYLSYDQNGIITFN